VRGDAIVRTHPPVRLPAVLLLLTITTILVACSGQTVPPGPPTGTGPAAAEVPVPGTSGPATAQVASPKVGPEGAFASKKLNIYAWSEYIPEDLLGAFTDATGAEVNYDAYASNEELMAKLQAGGSGYDIIVPSDYVVTQLVARDMLEPLDKDALGNLGNIDPRFLGRYYDPDNAYTVPYQWGTTGIVYKTTTVTPAITTFADLWRPDLKDRLVVLDDQREMLGIGLVQLGYDRNSTDATELAAARDRLIDLKPNIRLFDSDSPKTALLGGEVDAGVVYNGEAALVARENPDFAYVLPADGCGVWFDNLAIPKGAPHKDAALAFIDFVLLPASGALITRDFPYSNPNQAALDFLRTSDPALYEAYTKSNATNPPPDAVARCVEVRDVGDALPLWGQMWTAVKGGE
jgi:spermidine/putrescine-binding protein